MIPTKHRLNLRHHPEFFNYAKRHYNIFFVVFYQCFSQDRESKLAVIVPKKNINKRVWRNKIKRQVYHLALPLLQKTPGLAMAVVIKQEFLKLSPGELGIQLNKTFTNLIKK